MKIWYRKSRFMFVCDAEIWLKSLSSQIESRKNPNRTESNRQIWNQIPRSWNQITKLLNSWFESNCPSLLPHVLTYRCRHQSSVVRTLIGNDLMVLIQIALCHECGHPWKVTTPWLDRMIQFWWPCSIEKKLKLCTLSQAPLLLV